MAETRCKSRQNQSTSAYLNFGDTSSDPLRTGLDDPLTASSMKKDVLSSAMDGIDPLSMIAAELDNPLSKLSLSSTVYNIYDDN